MNRRKQQGQVTIERVGREHGRPTENEAFSMMLAELEYIARTGLCPVCHVPLNVTEDDDSITAECEFCERAWGVPLA